MLIINYLLLIFKHLFKNKLVSHIGSLDYSSRAHASLSLEIRVIRIAAPCCHLMERLLILQ